MLYVIGLGLSDEQDITVKGLNAVKSCERIYLEAYTSILMVQKEKLEEFYGKKIILADREMVEQKSDEILKDADKINVAFLVVGDPFGATTHTDLILRAKQLNIKVKPIHNASIMNAIGSSGLQLYNFGQTISIVFFHENWRPYSFYDKLKINVNLELHTLLLLDIKVKEQSWENMARGKLIYEPPRYMTVNQALDQLLEVENAKKDNVINSNSICCGIARVGSDDEKIVSGTIEELLEIDFGAPLHSLILCGKMHFLEADYLKTFAVNVETFNKYASIFDN
ncbi:diphthine synthase [Clydaea vesicula]|uniref:diphthine methyl ester synthase n=1 Tax=Clydaea vesicula TaxID=447962 RepID=A0AAD5TX17_9FUNG|nr:diphthine synthase [Clydaea vesicula]KAJ3380831.1 diphthine synthase [Lobulomyces angularis]